MLVVPITNTSTQRQQVRTTRIAEGRVEAAKVDSRCKTGLKGWPKAG